MIRRAAGRCVAHQPASSFTFTARANLALLSELLSSLPSRARKIPHWTQIQAPAKIRQGTVVNLRDHHRVALGGGVRCGCGGGRECGGCWPTHRAGYFHPTPPPTPSPIGTTPFDTWVMSSSPWGVKSARCNLSSQTLSGSELGFLPRLLIPAASKPTFSILNRCNFGSGD